MVRTSAKKAPRKKTKTTARAATAQPTPATPDARAWLQRFTTLPVLIDILTEKRLTLLSPQTWADRNDAYFLERYRSESKLASVLALCFAGSSQTFHHWYVFSNGPAGACIEFRKAKLLSHFGGPGYRHQRVAYKKVGELRAKVPPRKSWPFIKRESFQDEQEYRVIFEHKTTKATFHYVPIDLGAIRRVTLSPWLPPAVYQSVRTHLKALATAQGHPGLEISHSTLLENEAWKGSIQGAG